MISVLLPVKDAEETLAACLRSLMEQTTEAMEVVAIDHGSRDGSLALLQHFRQRDSRLRIIQSFAESLPAALNEGLKAAQGEFIARMDADDLCLAGRMQSQMDLLRDNPALGLVGCWVEVFSDSGVVSPAWQEYEIWVNSLIEDSDIRREMFIECPLPHPSWMARRELYKELGGYLDNGLPEDYEFVLRTAQTKWKFGKVPEAVLAWRDHPERHSRTHDRYGRQPFMRLRAKYLKSLVIKESPCVVWGAGDRGRLLVRMLMDEGAKIESVVGISDKENPPSSAHGIKVIKPEELPDKLPGPLIACVGAPGAREEIRKWAKGKKLLEGKDFWFAS